MTDYKGIKIQTKHLEPLDNSLTASIIYQKYLLMDLLSSKTSLNFALAF